VIFAETALKGAFTVDIEKRQDNRGFFARSWCQNEFREKGLNPRVLQCNISYNEKKGTFRGMHYQVPPHEEAKLVRCTRGSIYDVIVDLRHDSPTFGKHLGIELSEENRRMLYIPEKFAHGFVTLQDQTEVFYQMSEVYAPEYARGIRWNDPYFDILLPMEIAVISDRDRTYPDFVNQEIS
jgi:dTDP-4-dehydrorhamnose 3,5-epimerase